jgi:DNA adenine methylase
MRGSHEHGRLEGRIGSHHHVPGLPLPGVSILASPCRILPLVHMEPALNETVQTPRIEIPNVSQVPKYSPLRYPGGKVRWYPIVKRWLQGQRGSAFVEPFAGGASMGLAAAVEGLARRVVLVEANDDVAAFWQTVLGEDVGWLLEQIMGFDLSRNQIERWFAGPQRSTRERAFRLFVHNRISRGGITAPGAGLLKRGENGRGLMSRWYPKTLCRRIQAIVAVRDRIQFIHGDGFETIRASRDDPNALFFVDPPYTVAGRRLYGANQVDHADLLALLSHLSGEFLATYDEAEEVIALADRHGFEHMPVVVRSTHHQDTREVLIGRQLRWLSRSETHPGKG